MPGRGCKVWNGSENHRWKVIAVPDGDTLMIAGGPHGQCKEWLRLLCIDTPEHGQVGFEGSREAMKALVFGKYCRVEPEKLWKYRRDRYGRTLAYVFEGDLLVNAEMVRQGWSTYFTRFGRGRFAETMGECQVMAESERRGVWANYNQGEKWQWGRGRAKPHFKTSEAMQRYAETQTRKERLKDG